MPRAWTNPRVSRSTRPRPLTSRFSIERIGDVAAESTLAEDVRRGLGAARKWLPPKHFYDERGSDLFDVICELPEYYLTRAEQRLLESSARDVIAFARPTDLVELGSGAAKKTRTLFDAAAALGSTLRYHPFDVCEPMLRAAADRLLAEYPWLEVHALAADYERHLDHLPRGGRRLIAFLGSTIGNFTPWRATRFLRHVALVLKRREFFLLGADLVKPVDELVAAYDDRAGVTAEFNRNVLHVINRDLHANFAPEAFEHVALYDRRRSQMEMYLRARTPQRVEIRDLGMTVELAAGETIHTEISRKFTRRRLEALCRRVGLEPRRWFQAEDPAFGLLLAEKR